MEKPEEELTEDQLIENAIEESSEEASTDDADPEVSNEEASTEDATVTPEFKPEEWELNVSGNKIIPQSREQLVNLAQMGQSYSNNMAKLNEERRALKEQYTPLEQYAAMDKMFKENPEFQNHIANAINSYKTKTALGTSEETPQYVQQLLQRVESVEEYKTKLEQKNADNQLMNELNTIKSQYPNVKWDVDDGQGTFTRKLLKHAMDNNITSLKSAFRDLMFDDVALNAKAEALKAAEQAKLAKQKAGKVGSGVVSGGKLDNLAYNSSLSYNDLMEKALEMVNQ